MRGKSVIKKSNRLADKEIEETGENEPVDAEPEYGERRIISDGSKGPVIEIIKKAASDADTGSDTDGSVKSEAETV